MEDNPRGQRDLVTTVLALIKTAAAMTSSPAAPAAGTVKALGPAMAFQILAASQFGRESALNLEQIVSLVHGAPPGSVDVILPYAELIG